MDRYGVQGMTSVAFTVLVALDGASEPKFLMILVGWVYAQADHLTERTEEHWLCCILYVDLSWSNC